jgi:hypothetical protein
MYSIDQIEVAKITAAIIKKSFNSHFQKVEQVCSLLDELSLLCGTKSKEFCLLLRSFIKVVFAMNYLQDRKMSVLPYSMSVGINTCARLGREEIEAYISTIRHGMTLGERFDLQMILLKLFEHKMFPPHHLDNLLRIFLATTIGDGAGSTMRVSLHEKMLNDLLVRSAIAIKPQQLEALVAVDRHNRINRSIKTKLTIFTGPTGSRPDRRQAICNSLYNPDVAILNFICTHGDDRRSLVDQKDIDSVNPRNYAKCYAATTFGFQREPLYTYSAEILSSRLNYRALSRLIQLQSPDAKRAWYADLLVVRRYCST